MSEIQFLLPSYRLLVRIVRLLGTYYWYICWKLFKSFANIKYLNSSVSVHPHGLFNAFYKSLIKPLALSYQLQLLFTDSSAILSESQRNSLIKLSAECFHRR